MRWIPPSATALLLALAACAAPVAERVQAPSGCIAGSAYVRAVADADLAALTGLLTDSAVYEDVTFAYEVRGGESVATMLRGSMEALGEARLDVLHVVCDSIAAAIRWEMSGTHTAPLLGVPPTGETLTITGASFLEVSGGRIHRITDYLDRVGVETTLGIRP